MKKLVISLAIVLTLCLSLFLVSCGDNRTGVDENETHTVTLPFNYSYDVPISDVATLLCGGSYFGRGFESIIIPDDIVAGDLIKITYKGEMYTQESYPGTHVLNGEIVSYSFTYADVFPVSKENLTEAMLEEYYSLQNNYVILDRTGKYTTLEEYTGDKVYLVEDLQRYASARSSVQELRLYVSCMLAFNPRDLEDGTPVKTVSDLRNEKVSFDLDYHEIGDLVEKEEIETDITKHYFGYIGKNENGNDYIIYAPNVYSYYVSVKCTDDFGNVESVIRKIENDYFNRSYTGSNDEMHIDVVELFDDEILIVFPDFDSYALCQDELLNNLSALDTVLKINVSYLNAQNGSYFVENPYEYINLGYYYRLNEKNRFFSTYEEFCEAFANGLPSAEKLDVITAETFESNYVFMIVSTYSGGTYGFDISDARIVGNRVFFTTNKYIRSGLHDMWAATDYCIVLVPKEELGKLPNDISSVIDMQVGVYFDSPDVIGGSILDRFKVSESEAKDIAIEHFYLNYYKDLGEIVSCMEELTDGDNKDDYWYILIRVYVKEDEIVTKGGGFIYTIDKINGDVINVTVEE